MSDFSTIGAARKRSAWQGFAPDGRQPPAEADAAAGVEFVSRRRGGSSLDDADLVKLLGHSQVYREYERAFAQATGLPLALRPPTMWSLVHRGRRCENPLCALLAGSRKACTACLEMQEKACRPDAAATLTCHAGLCETAVPVRAGEQLVGYLQTGQVLLHKPTPARFRRIVRRLVERGCDIDPRELESAYFQSHVFSPAQYAGIVHLLEMFAMHLGSLSNQIVLRDEAGESPFSRRVKAYVAEHQSDPIHLDEAAEALHVSTFYFCKMFKKATGLTFTDYLGRLRIERTKKLLLDPHRRVSEIAYEVGFGSLTHFNRVFRRLVGKSPSSYRRAAWRLRT
jgi:AraC-like DNA-binding protein